jgi:hypothetical protein
VLSPNTAYGLICEEFYHGDYWYDKDDTATPDPLSGVGGFYAVTASGAGPPFTMTYRGAGYLSSAGMPNLRFTTVSDPSAGLVIGQTAQFGRCWGSFVYTTAAKTANYSMTAQDAYVLLNGNLTATLPSATTNFGQTFTVLCYTAGTNRLQPILSQTINGAPQWTNTGVWKYTTVLSDGANWVVVGQN